MRNRLNFVALFASICTGAWLCSATIAAETPPAGPQVSKAVAKPLKAAQEALQAKKLDEALAKVKEAQAASGDKTPYDSFVINQLLLFIYVQKQDYSAAAPILESAAQSQYATPDQQRGWLKALMGIEYQQKDYAKTIDVGQQLLKHGVTDAETYTTIADCQNKLGKFKEAAATIGEVLQHQDKPEERLLAFQWNCYLKANDDADAEKVIEKLVTYYPKPDYWLNALAPLLRMDIKDAHLQLNVYRLMNEVGVLKRATDYSEMAEIALDAGYPGETQVVLEQAFARNVFVEQREKDRYQHLLDGAKQRAATDKAQLGNVEHDAGGAATGDALVQLGAAYMTYGQNDKAVAAITKGIAKGGLKRPDEANLLLGITQFRLKNLPEAQKAFDKAASSSNVGYARLGKLWSLRASGHSA
ncbi:MAG: tetratricopeptide repeat protein [Steroidobacteraceae bacterium]|jgi:tetratricopeptide repeat protein